MYLKSLRMSAPFGGNLREPTNNRLLIFNYTLIGLDCKGHPKTHVQEAFFTFLSSCHSKFITILQPFCNLVVLDPVKEGGGGVCGPEKSCFRRVMHLIVMLTSTVVVETFV